MKEVYCWMRKTHLKGSFQVMGNFPRRVYEES